MYNVEEELYKVFIVGTVRFDDNFKFNYSLHTQKEKMKNVTRSV